MANYQYINSTGVIVPDTSNVLVTVTVEYQKSFGTDLVVTPDSPAGLLIALETLARDEVINNNAAVANQINPNIADGTFLDAIMALTGMQRAPAVQTYVSAVTLSGVAGTVIPAGSVAQTGAGDKFQTVSNCIIGGGGTATVDFKAVAFGPIACAAHALNTIVSSVLGWEVVDNVNAGVTGSNTQSDQQARLLRNNTLGYQGVALNVAITSALYAVTGVQSLKYQENYSAVPQGMLVSVTHGATLANTVWGLNTTGDLVVGTNPLVFAASTLKIPYNAPWPVAKYGTTGNVALTGLGTQGGGDWAAPMTAGDVVLVKNNTTATEDGVYIVAAGAWSRHPYALSGATIKSPMNGINMAGNSIYACINGGSDLDVTAALLENKSNGCGWTGSVATTVTEPASGENYTVQYDRPTQVPIDIEVTTTNGDATNIKNAVLAYVQGLVDGLAGWKVGVEISPWEIASAVVMKYPTYFIKLVRIQLDPSGGWTSGVLNMSVNQLAVTDLTKISVIVSP